ncbi:hypothetical protein Stsp02_47370 [Streptomyces sp. NBRC 14336]|uniref:Uncharacterized protein n=1 Tax=Streptomyces fuscus TaxID=3048495 RepID=A0ABT7IS29_9ACTN|nr:MULTISPECIES: hypothetical protein [Streptomyces]WBO79432.1 hypothetical protein SBE_003132 [Streptomyces sp. SBE_14.2]MCM1974580.1 hypothetical protein [Streptomyces sp. G1]MDL2075400.1 hypothetical protein [Streptomyces fuscus]SBT92407.1 hypothetical protein GA0115233_104459 [Streptomyces sp. DI166]GLW49076.1 hypothetical protein Stsp02_47370 [Streptomyces sp. NBRC 14336]
MGWTHDYNDVARNRRSGSSLSGRQGGSAPQLAGSDPRVGIPRILRRRARWVSVRLRHPRG